MVRYVRASSDFPLNAEGREMEFLLVPDPEMPEANPVAKL
jgi:hypothetical protein